MGLFSRSKPSTQAAPPPPPLSVDEHARLIGQPGPLWTDTLGRWSTRAAQVLLVLFLATVVVFAGVQLRIVVIPALLALILASALHPMVAWMARHRIPRLLATVLTLLAGVTALGGVVTLVVMGVRAEWDNLAQAVTDGIDAITSYIQSGALPLNLDDFDEIEELRDELVGFLTSAQFGATALSGAATVVELATGLVLTVVLLFFFLKDGEKMWAFLISPLHGPRELRAQRVGRRAVGVLGGYLTGTATVAAVDAVFIGLALWILQVPLALPLALVVFVGAFIPIVGATVAGTLAALVALVTNDFTTALIVVAVVIAVNQLEGNLLAPFVLGNAIKLHPLVVLVSLTIGTILGGIIGTFISVPIAAVGWAVIKAWRNPDAAEEPLRRRPLPRIRSPRLARASRLAR